MHKETTFIRRLFFVILATAALLFFISPAQAASDDEWKITIAPYFFAMAADYDSTIDGRTANIDMSFKDIIDDMDVLGGALRMEAWKGDWGILLDGIYTNMEGDFGPKDNLSTKTTDIMIDLLGAYRLLKKTFLDRPLIVDIGAGLRYHYLKQKAHFSLSGPRLKIKAGESYDWVEPLVGTRIGWSLTEKLTLITSADMGGFGIGSASKLTWSITSLLNYKFSRHWSVAGGYRYLDMDYSRGSGNSKFGFDGTLDGVIIGVTWRN
jgi:opacity protein-like surface antigen